MTDSNHQNRMCLFCEDHPAIENSHVIPKFVTDWIKETAPTPYLRSATNPNQRHQDGDKLPILCPSCETLFSNFEKNYSNNIFKKIANYRKSPKMPLKINAKDKKCVLSIFWRQIAYSINFDDHKNIYPEEIELMKEKADFFKKIINEPNSTLEDKPFSTYLIPLDKLSVDRLGLPQAANNYYEYERQLYADLNFLDNFERAWIIVKLPFQALVCDLLSKTDEWDAPDFIDSTELEFSEIKKVPDGLKIFFHDKLNLKAKETYESISEEQKAKIETDIKNSVEDIKNKGWFKSLHLNNGDSD